VGSCTDVSVAKKHLFKNCLTTKSVGLKRLNDNRSRKLFSYLLVYLNIMQLEKSVWPSMFLVTFKMAG
jgi:hypothetical protein